MSGQTFFRLRESLVEKTLTAAEKRKREEVAKAIKRENPGMDKSMKMAIATATAKRVAEDAVSDYMAKGGKVTTAPYKKPRKAEKTDYSSKHIGGKGEHKSGKAANTTSPRPVGEETEQIDELRKSTIASYIKKASSSSHPNSASNLASRAAHKLATSSDGDDGEKEDHKSFNRSKNISKAVDRLTREEIEDHSDPLSEEEYDRIRDMYGKGAARGMMNSRWNPHHPEFYGKKRSTSSPSPSSSSSSSDKHYHKVPFAQKDDAKKEGMRWDSGAKKWYHSSASASKASKFQKEEVELVSELKKSTLGSYVKKANKEVADNAWKAGTAGAPDLLQQGKLRAKAFFKAKRRMAGIDKATDRLTKEETEQIDELSKATVKSYADKRSAQVFDAPPYPFKKKPMSARVAKNTGDGMMRALKRMNKANEEVEEVNELKKSTLASYTSKVVDPVYGMPRSTKKIKQRLAGLQRAHQRAIGKKPTSEEVVSEGPYSSGQLKPTQAQLTQAQKIPSGGRTTVIRDKDEKGTYTLTKKDGKVVSKTYESIITINSKENVEIEEASKTSGKDWRMAAREAIKKKLPYSPTNMPNYSAAKKAAVKEQVTQVDEYSTEYLASYKKAAGASARAADQKGDYKKGNKRFKGILAATRKQFKNEAGKK